MNQEDSPIRNDPCVLCRARLLRTSIPEIIIVAEREFDYWVMTYQTQYEFIAKGTYPEMQRFKELMKETA